MNEWVNEWTSVNFSYSLTLSDYISWNRLKASVCKRSKREAKQADEEEEGESERETFKYLQFYSMVCEEESRSGGGCEISSSLYSCKNATFIYQHIFVQHYSYA